MLWVNAASRETLSTAMSASATLELPALDEQDKSAIVVAVKHWLTAPDHWLLILDNADELTLSMPYAQRPAQRRAGTGHLLLTTREAATGRMQRLDMQKMDESEGMCLLLRGAPYYSPTPRFHRSARQSNARLGALREMDGLPLALEQAGAYIEETPCTLATFLKIYVTATWNACRTSATIPMQRLPSPQPGRSISSGCSVTRRPPTCCACGFLAPDAIPEEMMVAGASELGPLLSEAEQPDAIRCQAIGR